MQARRAKERVLSWHVEFGVLEAHCFVNHLAGACLLHLHIVDRPMQSWKINPWLWRYFVEHIGMPS